MSELIYITEDEEDILELLSMKLTSAGYRTRGFTTAKEMLESMEQELPELILLDLMLPDLDGLEACRRIKSNPAWELVPIVMLTARSDISDRVKGLEYGADDYIIKPFDSCELLARIKAVLRRSGWESSRNILNITDEFRLDFNRYEAWIKGQRVDLTITEFKILQLLTRHPGWVYKRSQILDHLWGTDKVVIERTVDVHIRNLREKLGEFSYMLQNVRGLGYKFDAASKESKSEKNQP